MEALLSKKPWWNYLEEDLRELLQTSMVLMKKIENWDQTFHDYSFTVFPAGKAYEGFLKKMFLDLNFISNEEYYGSQFRIGRALNPSYSDKSGRESVYEKLSKHCEGGKELADTLWVTWKNSRNLIFHWFPDEKRAISVEEAKIKIQEIVEAIDQAFATCKMDSM